jgi:hypothetical protein
MTNHHDVVTRIDEVIRVGAELIEVRGDGRKDIVAEGASVDRLVAGIADPP